MDAAIVLAALPDVESASDRDAGTRRTAGMSASATKAEVCELDADSAPAALVAPQRNGLKASTTLLAEELGVSPLLEEIQSYGELKADWDLEGAKAIAADAVLMAAELVVSVASEAVGRGLGWFEPDIGPDPDGGVDVMWEASGRRVLLMTRPGRSGTVLCVTKEADGMPIKKEVPIAVAISHALCLLEDAA